MWPQILTILLCALVFVYLVWPIIALKTKVFPTRPKLMVISPAQLPAAARKFLTDVSAQLEALDFVTSAPVAIQNARGGIAAVKIIGNNAEFGDTAMASVGYTTDANEQLLITHRYLEFMSKFPEEGVFVTTNKPEEVPFPPAEKLDIFRVPELESPSRMHKLHRMRVERAVLSFKRGELMKKGAELLYITESTNREVAAQIKNGLTLLNKGKTAFNLTLKGAYLTTWWTLPPMKQVRRAKAQIARALALKDMGFSLVEGINPGQSVGAKK